MSTLLNNININSICKMHYGAFFGAIAGVLVHAAKSVPLWLSKDQFTEFNGKSFQASLLAGVSGAIIGFALTRIIHVANRYFQSRNSITSAEKEFEAAWKNSQYTQYQKDDVDVNAVIISNYNISSPVTFTRSMLWDMEKKKGWDPKSYIPYVVSDGNSWNRTVFKNGDQEFVRSSRQRQWKNGEVYADVFEKVYVNEKQQRITFLGVQTLVDPNGKILKAQNSQPLFHVQHSVGGTEERPLNEWRIIHLTHRKDPSLIDLFNAFKNPKRLPGYIEQYLKKDLNVGFSFK